MVQKHLVNCGIKDQLEPWQSPLQKKWDAYWPSWWWAFFPPQNWQQTPLKIGRAAPKGKDRLTTPNMLVLGYPGTTRIIPVSKLVPFLSHGVRPRMEGVPRSSILRKGTEPSGTHPRCPYVLGLLGLGLVATQLVGSKLRCFSPGNFPSMKSRWLLQVTQEFIAIWPYSF